VRDLVRSKIERIREELTREGLDRTTRALRVAELVLTAARLPPAVAVARERFYEMTKAPPQFRRLRDLQVRLGSVADAAALAALDSPRDYVERRLARGDLLYVGDLQGRVLAQAWFHRGPAPFDEDAATLARFALAHDTFWSYAAFVLPEARLSGVFVKVFQTALRDILTVHGAARVQCRVKAANTRSIALHERTGFRLLGTVTALAVPGARVMSWQGDGGGRRWVERRQPDALFTLPPERA